jgi:hypothetical protein
VFIIMPSANGFRSSANGLMKKAGVRNAFQIVFLEASTPLFYVWCCGSRACVFIRLFVCVFVFPGLRYFTSREASDKGVAVRVVGSGWWWEENSRVEQEFT